MMWLGGGMADLESLEDNCRYHALKKKSVKVNDRGRKSIKLSTRTGTVLMAWREE